MSKQIKISNKQIEKLVEQGLLPGGPDHINGLVAKKDISALAHHYAKSDETGKSGILKKSSDTHGEVFANRIKIRAKGVLEGLTEEQLDEQDIKEYKLTDKMDKKPDFYAKQVNEEIPVEEETLDETTTSASSGSYSSKYFIAAPGHENKTLLWKGGKIVEPNPNTHTQGVNAFKTTKGKLKEEALEERFGFNLGKNKEEVTFIKNMISKRNEITNISKHSDGSLRCTFGQYFVTINPNLGEIFLLYPDMRKVELTKNDVGNELFSQLVAVLQTGGTHLTEKENMKNLDEKVNNILKTINENMMDEPNPDQQSMDAPVTDELPSDIDEPQDTETNDFDVVSAIVDYANGSADDNEVLQLFSHLIKNQIYDKLDDDMSHTAQILMSDGIISQDGEIDMAKYQELVGDSGQGQPESGQDAVSDNPVQDMGMSDGTDTASLPQDSSLDAGLNPDDDSDLDENSLESNIREPKSIGMPTADTESIYNYFKEILFDKGKIIKGDVNNVVYHTGMSYQEVLELALDCAEDSKYGVTETTGSASSGQFNGPLRGRPTTPEDMMFETEPEMTEDQISTEGLFKIVDNVKADVGQDHEVISQLEAIIQQYGDFDNPDAPVNPEAVAAFKQILGTDTGAEASVQQDQPDIMDNIQEEKISSAFTNLKKIRDANAVITKADMSDIRKEVMKANKAKGVQFVQTAPEGEKPHSEFTKMDNTYQQDEINTIRKGMEDLEYETEPSELFNHNFENGINPKTETPAVEDQFGNKYPKQAHANVMDSDLGSNLLKIIKKKQEAVTDGEPMYAKDEQPVKMVKENDSDLEDKILRETDTVVITESEQKRIDENVAQMRKLIGFDPSKTLSTKGNVNDPNLFRTFRK